MLHKEIEPLEKSSTVGLILVVIQWLAIKERNMINIIYTRVSCYNGLGLPFSRYHIETELKGVDGDISIVAQELSLKLNIGMVLVCQYSADKS